jgi:LysR family transcriptional regulator, glycine cleavage system transcriptional activator
MPRPVVRLPLQTLPAFRVVARLVNLRAAAEELHLTHSALSQQIKLLEQQIGFNLFDRRGRRLVLNAAGAALLRSVEPALTQLDDGVRAAAAASGNEAQRIRITLLSSFANRWLLPRMGRWREQHPDIGIELHTSPNVMDLQREGFHAALRQGAGRWPGLEAVCLTDSPMIVVGSPETARRLYGRDVSVLVDEPLLGDAGLWQRWFALAGVRARVNPVASFNDAGLMLQAAEQNIGLALAREILVADALRDGRLLRLSPVAMPEEQSYSYWLAFPPSMRDWPPLLALQAWLFDELARSQRELQGATETKTAGRSGSRSRAPSAAPRKRRAR